MPKLYGKILIISFAVFGAGIFAVPVTFAQPPDNLVVLFEQTPLFNETNFLPGQAVARWVKVTNNSGSTQRIATEAINKSDPDDFSSQLSLIIKEGATVIFNDTLEQFFDQGETYLSNLGSGAITQYDFTITFNSSSGNPWQEAALGFDILVGFEGTEGGLPLPAPGGGTGGDLPPGLTIFNETETIIAATSVTIEWNTSYPSTSYVIYGAEGENHTLDLSDSAGSPPKYGYSNATLEYDINPKVTFHSVNISGLVPGVTYYYRAVSHASLAVSTEHNFTTLTEINEGEGEGIQPIQGARIAQGEGTSEEKGGSVVWIQAGQVGEDIVEEKFLAAINTPFNGNNFWGLLVVIILILVVLFFLSRRKKESRPTC